MVKVKRILLDILHVRRTLIVLFVPFLLLLLPLLVDTSEAKCAYGLLLMGIFWITESLPLAATALLPVIVFPILGVQRASEVSGNYIKDSSMFGIGGLTIAIAVEKWKLHKRIALKALLLVGSEPKWLMFGFMFPTWFLSMWVSNTATTAMMIPIVGAVMDELKEVKQSSENENNMTMDVIDDSKPDAAKIDINVKDESANSGNDVNSCEKNSKSGISNDPKTDSSKTEDKPAEENPEYVRMCKGMALCIAYAANVGGTGSVSGTGPNIIMKGQADLLFQEYGYDDSGVNFASWMVFALPGSFICFLLTWIWLSFYFLGWRGLFCKRGEKEKDKRVRAVITKAYRQLGPMSFAEISVLTHFAVLLLLWFFRSPPEFDGWGSFFKSGYVGDSAAAILICLSLFTFPSERPTVLCFRQRNVYTTEERPRGPVPPLLDWYTVEKKFPWGVLLLIGGGFALADASEKSGLSALIGEQLEVFSDLEPWTMNLVLTIVIALCTEVTSNTATSTLLLPIMGNLALRLNMNPLYLMFPCVISTSFAFMLPVATPPNAIVFATGYLTVKDMVLAGSVMNILCVGVLALETNTWGLAFFQLDQLPSGFNRTHNSSAISI